MTAINTDPSDEFDIDRILADLNRLGPLPREALEQAIAHRDRVVPAFLDILEDYLRDLERNTRYETALFLIVHLLAQFREPRAYPLVMRLLMLDDEQVERTLGEATTATLPNVVISLFDGDPAPLYRVIENPEADPFVRWSLFAAFGFLAKEGRIGLEEAKGYLLKAYAELQPQGESPAWVGWQSAVSLLGLTEFKDLVRKAFASGKIDRSNMSFRDFEKDLDDVVHGRESFEHRNLGYFDDTIGTFSTWYGFTEEYWRKQQEEPEPLEPFDMTGLLPGDPYINPLRHVGRNDSCPCGSGKKYKKCCLVR